MIKLKIPSGTCKGCPYLKTQITDHNYYGEVSSKTVCLIFDCGIDGFHPCKECALSNDENQEAIAKYADFLVKEINQMASEVNNHTLDILLREVVDIVQYDNKADPIVPFNSLKEIIDRLKE